MTIKNIAMYFVLIISPGISYSVELDSYLCVADKVTGFKYINNDWESGEFDPSTEKYVVRVVKKDEIYYKEENDGFVGVYLLGEDDPQFTCKNQNKIVCKDRLFGAFYFSKTTRKFLMTHPFGYWYKEGGETDSPAIAIGRCSKL